MGNPRETKPTATATEAATAATPAEVGTGAGAAVSAQDVLDALERERILAIGARDPINIEEERLANEAKRAQTARREEFKTYANSEIVKKMRAEHLVEELKPLIEKEEKALQTRKDAGEKKGTPIPYQCAVDDLIFFQIQAGSYYDAYASYKKHYAPGKEIKSGLGSDDKLTEIVQLFYENWKRDPKSTDISQVHFLSREVEALAGTILDCSYRTIPILIAINRSDELKKLNFSNIEEKSANSTVEICHSEALARLHYAIKFELQKLDESPSKRHHRRADGIRHVMNTEYKSHDPAEDAYNKLMSAIKDNTSPLFKALNFDRGIAVFTITTDSYDRIKAQFEIVQKQKSPPAKKSTASRRVGFSRKA